MFAGDAMAIAPEADNFVIILEQLVNDTTDEKTLHENKVSSHLGLLKKRSYQKVYE